MDRCHQARVKNALEPEREARFEPRSYGFRPGRCCQDAAEALYGVLRGRARRVRILDADLSAAFDKIGHAFLLGQLGTFPAREMIAGWLRAGVLEAGKGFAPTEEGTPAREMPEPARPAELAHRHPVLEPDPRTRGQSGLPLNAAAVNEPQLDTGTSGLHPPRRSRQNGHHTQDDPEPGKLQWQDTPDEQDSLAKRKINCHRT